MTRRVVLSMHAQRHAESIFRYIEAQAGRATADRFVAAILRFCEGLEIFPERGTKRDDIRQNLRIVGYRRRVTIAFVVGADEVAVLGIYYGGQDFESDLGSE